MKTFRLFIKVSFLLVSTSSLLSCNHKPDYSYSLIKVDSIHVSNTLTANSPFTIDFFGIIGADGCHSFSNFNIKLYNNNLEIEAWSKFDRSATLCPTVIVYLTGHSLTYIIPSAGTYNLKIKQPDNSFLEKQLIIN